MWFHKIILLVFTSLVYCDNFNHEFGEDFNDVFSSETGVCGVMRPWIHEEHETTNIVPIVPNGDFFIKPQAFYSCVLSEPFSMNGGGQLNLTVYMYPRSSADMINLLVYEKQESSNVIVEQITSSLALPGFTFGWNTLSIDLPGNDAFEGFVAIVGRATADSDVIVDYIEYIPPNDDDEDPCEDCEPETLKCIEYDFEEYFDSLFNSYLPTCSNTELWESISVNDINGITPKSKNAPSCTSTFINIGGSGTLYVRIQIDTESYFDSIAVIITDDQNTDHFVTFNKFSDDYTTEIHTLEIPLHVENPYLAQLSFMGLATEGATVLVESLKYVPDSWDEENCIHLIEARKHRNKLI